MSAHLEFLHVTGMHAALLDGLGVKVKVQNLALLQEFLESHLQSNDSFKLPVNIITMYVVHLHPAPDEQILIRAMVTTWPLRVLLPVDAMTLW